MTKSSEIFDRAVKVIPGGVNSPVRAFGSVGLTPRFVVKADGARIIDCDGNSYIDYIGSWGPMILGHNQADILDAVKGAIENSLSFGAATEIEVEIAELITKTVPSIDMIRMVNSGTEAVMSALRLARGYTKKDKIIKFAGCYHGHCDAMLVAAGSGVMTAGVPDSAGVPKGVANDTLTAVYNDIDSVRELFESNNGNVAAVIVEPVGANMGVVLPEEGFLKDLRLLCNEYNALLIFDEVITGFRLAPGGAGQYFNVMADINTFGKIIGGGMPVGAYGGRREIMEMVAPVGPVYQAGTLSGNPVAMSAGLKQLQLLNDNPVIYLHINRLGAKLANGMKDIVAKYNAPIHINYIGSLVCMFFTGEEVTDYSSAKTSNTEMYAKYFRFMLDKGIYLAPAQFEAVFISYAHTDEDIEYTLRCIEEFVSTEF